MYAVHTDGEVREALAHLPEEVSATVSQLRVALEVRPWSTAASINPSNEAAEVRCYVFHTAIGEGMLWYQITESSRRVDLLRLAWIEDR